MFNNLRKENVMKRIIITLLTIFSINIVSMSCPSPTSHFVSYVGATLLTNGFQKGVINKEYVGAYGSLGYEDPMRYTITSLSYRYVALGIHQVGVTEAINIIPMWIFSPINLHILLGMGDNIEHNEHYFYGSIGMELSIGQLHCPVQFFIRDEYNFIKNNADQNYVSCGFKFWIGKDW